MKKFGIFLFFSLSLSSLTFAQEPQESKTPQEPTKTLEQPAENITKVDPTKAKELMLAARKAKSEKDLSEIKDIKIASIVKLILPQDTFEVSNETTIKFPNKSLTVVNGPFGEIKNAYDGNGAWAMTPGGVQELLGDNAVEFENAVAGDPLSILKNFDKEDYKIEFLGEGTFEGQVVNIVMFTTNNGHQIKLYLDSKTNMLVGKSFQSKAAGIIYNNEEIYSDFQKFDSVQIPVKRTLKRNDKLFAEIEVKEVKINLGAEDKIFLKP
jgi:outer membrane lipoprotein-sorting protein